MRTVAVLVVACCACGRLDFDPMDARFDGTGVDGTGVDAPPTCANWGPFSAPVHVGELATGNQEYATAVSADQRSIVFDSDRNGGTGWDLYEATRTDAGQAFGIPARMTTIDTASDEDNPAISPDGLRVYYGDNSSGMPRIWTASRSDRGLPFGSAMAVAGDFSTFPKASTPALSPDELTLYFAVAPASGSDWEIYVATRPQLTAAFGTATHITALVSPYGDWTPSVSSDGLELFFQTDRVTAGNGSYDIYVSRRPTLADAWGTPVPVPSVATSMYSESDPTISNDGTTLWFAIDSGPQSAGGADIYFATRACP